MILDRTTFLDATARTDGLIQHALNRLDQVAPANAVQAARDQLKVAISDIESIWAAVSEILYHSRSSQSSGDINVQEDLSPTLHRVENLIQILLAQHRDFLPALEFLTEATESILSNVPPSRHQVSPSTLPTSELVGQLHALHGNTLEWFMHLDKELGEIRSKVFEETSPPAPPIEPWGPLNELNEQLDRLVREALNGQPDWKSILERADNLEAASSHVGLRTNVALTIQMLTALSIAKTNPDRNHGPKRTPLDVQPLNLSCRTHGVLSFRGSQLRIPLDILGARPRSSLLLSLEASDDGNSATVNATLSDAGLVVFHHTATTKHTLISLPGDALHLLHSSCPKFLFRLPGCPGH